MRTQDEDEGDEEDEDDEDDDKDDDKDDKEKEEDCDDDDDDDYIHGHAHGQTFIHFKIFLVLVGVQENWPSMVGFLSVRVSRVRFLTFLSATSPFLHGMDRSCMISQMTKAR